MANPALMAANPLLAMSMMNSAMQSGQLMGRSSMGGAQQSQPAAGGGQLKAPNEQAPVGMGPSAVGGAGLIDPDVQELCDYFNIEERHARKLSDIMKKRQDTFEADIYRLYDVLERANSPAGLLVVKMREMEEGTFVGKVKPDADLLAVSKKLKLDEQAEGKLADILARYDEDRRKEYVKEIEKHLEVSNRPSAMAMMLLKKLGAGEPLGRPGQPAPGSWASQQNQSSGSGRGGGGDRDRDRDRGGRSRSRGGRDRSRGGGRDKRSDRRSRSRRR